MEETNKPELYIDKYLANIFSNNSAPTEYYIQINKIFSTKLIEDAGFISFLKRSILKYNFFDYNSVLELSDVDYAREFDENYNDPKLKNKSLMNERQWLYSDSSFFRIQEMHDGRSTVLNFLFNPKLTFELVSKFLKDLIKDISIMYSCSITMNCRIKGVDNKARVVKRILYSINKELNSNYKDLIDIPTKIIEGYFMRYGKIDLEKYLEMIDVSHMNAAAISKNFSAELYGIINNFKLIVGNSEIPPFTLLYKISYDGGLLYSNYQYTRPTPLLLLQKYGVKQIISDTLCLDWISDFELTGLYRHFESMFYKIVSVRIFENEKDTHNKKELELENYKKLKLDLEERMKSELMDDTYKEMEYELELINDSIINIENLINRILLRLQVQSEQLIKSSQYSEKYFRLVK